MDESRRVKTETQVEAEAEKLYEKLSAQGSVGGKSQVTFEDVHAFYMQSLLEQGYRIISEEETDLDLTRKGG